VGLCFSAPNKAKISNFRTSVMFSPEKNKNIVFRLNDETDVPGTLSHYVIICDQIF
jgi:hypothetical protein